ncbi:MAG: hypothetical protein ACRDIF_03975 [Actinomycetota bacterium]
MSRAKDLYERVLVVQRQLGTGEAEEALAAVPELREEAIRLLDRASTLTSFDRSYAAAAYAFSTITNILALAEAREPLEFVPRIRGLAADAARRFRRGTPIWKALAAAAEMLARAGDTEGSAWAIRKAEQLQPGEDDLIKLAGSIKSMYPSVFAQVPEEVPDEPPPIAERRGRRPSPPAE